ncbi:DUF58 domain-containing protein [Mycetocola tolaasinivorans]|uniref:DUF58 domain-containing protein n=1 Tax=Mycetocola tolaasinivorans TaxID=76635 RepID=UPI0015FEC9F4|nr:DUF58 domain-containing protein [Mycetocola tolaasinivorans]
MRRALGRVSALARRPAVGVTGRGWGVLVTAAVLLGGGIALGTVQLIAGAVLLVLVLIIATVVAAWPLGTIVVERILPTRIVSLEDIVRIRTRITGPAALRVASGSWKDVTGEGVSPIEDSAYLPATIVRLPDGRRELHGGVTVRALARGVHALGPLEVTLTDPLGVVRRRHLVGEADSLTVLPRPAAHVPLGGVTGQSLEGEAGRSSRRGESGLEDPIPRAYRPGDSIRRVNWRASARHGELMVRQEEASPSPAVFVILDTEAAHWPGPVLGQAEPHFEWAVSLAATAVLDAAERGWQPVLCESGTALTSRVTEAGRALTEPALLALARVQPQAGAAPLSALFTRLGSRDSVIAVLGTITPSAAAELAALATRIDSATALCVDEPAADVLAILENAGWTCRPVPLPDSVPTVFPGLEFPQ